MKTQRSGFTLVELLVVITIIGILMGLLIPAVNSAREAARSRECSTKVKNLGLAAMQYENAKGGLPGYVMDFGTFGDVLTPTGAVDPADSGAPGAVIAAHRKIGTWAVAILPWLDAQPTYERWTEDRYPVLTDATAGTDFSPSSSDFDGAGYHPEAAPNLAIMQCPSNPVELANVGRNSYVANTGMAHVRTATAAGGSGGGATATYAQVQNRNDGTIVAKYDGSTGVIGPDVRLDDIKDGQGNTILFTENVQAGPWHRAGFLQTPADATTHLAAVDASGELNMGGGNMLNALRLSKYTTGVVWHYEDPQAGQLNGLTPAPTSPSGAAINSVFIRHQINGGGASVSEDIFVLEMDVSNAVDLARPSSAHIDGVHAGMADGGTRFIPDSVDYRVYQALLTPRGKSSNVPWPEYILDAESL